MLQALMAGPLKRGLRSFPVYVSKYPLFAGIKLVVLTPLIGALNLVISRRIDRRFWPLVSLIFIGLSLALTQQSFNSALRLAQLLGLVGFAQYLAEHFADEDYAQLEKSLLTLAAGWLFAECLWFGWIPDKEILPGIRVSRLEGIVGESNYSGLLCAIVTASIWVRRRSWWCALGLVTVLLTSSRVALIVLVLAATIGLFVKLPQRLGRRLLQVFLLLLLSYPFILFGTEHLTTIEQQRWINQIYSARFSIHLSYLAMFFEHPFGVGYFHGPELFAQYAGLGSKLMLSGHTYPIDHAPVYQQHGLFIQVLSEFGVLGYIVFSYFLWKLLENALMRSMGTAFLLVTSMCGFVSLNVLGDFTFFYVISIPFAMRK